MRRSLKLKFACHEDWDSFVGDDKRRLCERCVRNVHDLSVLTRNEAQELFRHPPAEGLCVRYAHDGQGRVLFRSERYPGRQVWKRFVPPPRES